MANLPLLVTVLAGVATGQPQMCKDYLNQPLCEDAGCRWIVVNGISTCSRQCHEFGGAVATGGNPATLRAECENPTINCRWINHPTNPGLGKCGKQCAEFEVQRNCELAGYSSCRWATPDVTGGAAICTKPCATITDQTWCERVHCVFANGACRRKCLEVKMKAPCEAMGCTWITPQTHPGEQLTRCEAPTAPAPAGLVSISNGTLVSTNVTAKSQQTQFLEVVKKH
eukprot:gnl/MRDRNA2_/MRDRNA2_98556_c0_seq1.p1 gnl/MRDRNA2_/MRDRNA2_98556_c0~~gnl/MRDRNA2_/MRDRNA2_98556_c0_seq1.p1  ORF type:complete len:227 (-),score=16.80 gnl/MRDRNA2_/MRDRNA2_98556_c0_seq1:12-692(-)